MRGKPTERTTNGLKIEHYIFVMNCRPCNAGGFLFPRNWSIVHPIYHYSPYDAAKRQHCAAQRCTAKGQKCPKMAGFQGRVTMCGTVRHCGICSGPKHGSIL